MPPTDEMIDEAVRCLGGTTFTSFTATPATGRPFGTASTLRRQARPPTGCTVRFLLNGAAVPATGSRAVQRSATTSFRLEATQATVRRHLGTRTVTVDISACFFVNGRCSRTGSGGRFLDLVRRPLDRDPGGYGIRALNSCRARHNNLRQCQGQPPLVRGRREAGSDEVRTRDDDPLVDSVHQVRALSGKSAARIAFAKDRSHSTARSAVTRTCCPSSIAARSAKLPEPSHVRRRRFARWRAPWPGP